MPATPPATDQATGTPPAVPDATDTAPAPAEATDAPTPTGVARGQATVKVQWPHSRLTTEIDGAKEITSEPTKIPQGALSDVIAAGQRAGVTVIEIKEQ